MSEGRIERGGNGELRLPLTEPDEASKAAVREAMVIAGLLDAA